VPGVVQVVSVIVDSLDVLARRAEITVTCIVTGSEGPETGVFKYTGTFPPEGCPQNEAVVFVVYGEDTVSYGNEIVIY